MKIEITDPNGYLPYVNRTHGTFLGISSENTIRVSTRCRVEIEWELKRNNFPARMGFCRPGSDIEIMRNFWSKIFKKLGKSSEFVIHETNFNNTYIIDVPDFWNKTDTGRSVFTLFLRASACFHTKSNTILKTLKSYQLASLVIPALQWYLKGNTIPTYDKLTGLDYEGYTGFVAEFQALPLEEIKSKLVSNIIEK